MGASQQCVILGRGPTGLAAALVLANAGYQPLVIGPPGHIPAGALQLASNGFEALRRLAPQLADPLLACSTRLHEIEIKTLQDGRHLGRIEHGPRLYAGVGRASLIHLLDEACQNTGKISYLDSRITHITQQGKQARLLTEQGDILVADHLLATDGPQGAGRQFVAPHQTPRATAQLALRASLPKTAVPRGFAGPATRLWLGTACHLVSYPYGPDGRINLVLALTPQAGDSADQAARSRLNSSSVLGWLAEAVERWQPTPLWQASVLDCWRRGPVVLAGESAHLMPPHLAQGFGQSLMDIAALAEALAEEDLPRALSRMAAQRATAAASIARRAETAGAVMRLGQPAAGWRDKLLGITGGAVLDSFLADVWQLPELPQAHS
jgi:salicylate hydroxylase